jgi:2'-5' RNA ligase
MRCFIAIDIGDDVRNKLADLQKQLKEKTGFSKAVKWTRPDSIHLTLKFLGEIDRKESVSISKTVEQVAANYGKFELNVEGVGYFGKNCPRVLWAGCGEGSKQLKILQNDLENALAESGWKKEKRTFSPHLTLCRIKSRKAGYKIMKIAEEFSDYKIGSIYADKLKIYESNLTPDGAKYSVLAGYALSG